ncbi:MAG: SMI1/KNR4 family protein [Pirellulales bacterium]
MEITERISAAGATSEDIQSFEARRKTSLPKDYKRFLAEWNGGRPRPRQFEGPNGERSVLHFFFTLDPAAEYYYIEEEIDTFKDRLPAGFLPIASDPFGNLVLLALTPGKFGEIHFWEHEAETDEGKPLGERIAFISSNFTDFVANLS